jgi:hypothetical protein
MEDENHQPGHQCEYAAGKSNKRQPTQYPKRVKKLAVIVPADDAGMHRAFIHAVAVCVSD